MTIRLQWRWAHKLEQITFGVSVSWGGWSQYRLSLGIGVGMGMLFIQWL